MRVLLICSSARGHAIADALKRSPESPDIIAMCKERNPGVEDLAETLVVDDIMNFQSALNIAKKYKPNFAFIGPEDPIGGGLSDALSAAGIPCVAPTKSLGRLESSKGFTRNLLRKHGIDASPKFRVFSSDQGSEMYKFIDQELEGAFVVKYDALKGGKGVKVSGEHLKNIDEGVAYARECIAECGSVVIEEKLIGVEFSLLSFASGKTTVDMPAVQDHKRAFNGDTGPNTGGMGTISDAGHSLPFLTTQDLARASEINRLTAEALLKECNAEYKGILYGGFIAVKDGVRLIEYNARFGDPEALNILPLLESDFVTICQAILTGELSDELVRFAHKATVCKYITPEGYPQNNDQRDAVVRFPALPNNARLFYGNIRRDGDGVLHLGSSRTAGIVGVGSTIAEAETLAESLCQRVEGPVRHRSDIGTEALLNERSTTMQRLRSAVHS
ncbi:phosphoribosylamine--glycine ligase [Candidatus Peregrinibacteria bacterium CG10_big_fil_rev_8_21_14_0_10_55_24]|nr:MAG: phosphoribosylamine--glycine ligase [Candidatus Peregrinibacteria bacterium CG10_big_fil_rev_8_21_14_0_10_55_24]